MRTILIIMSLLGSLAAHAEGLVTTCSFGHFGDTVSITLEPRGEDTIFTIERIGFQDNFQLNGVARLQSAPGTEPEVYELRQFRGDSLPVLGVLIANVPGKLNSSIHSEVAESDLVSCTR